jgi:hypothetical protein
MTDVQAHLTDIITKHREELNEEGICICGWHQRGNDPNYPAHVAAVLLAEFDVLPKGELTEERAEFIQTNNWPPILIAQHQIVARIGASTVRCLCGREFDGAWLWAEHVARQLAWKQQP